MSCAFEHEGNNVPNERRKSKRILIGKVKSRTQEATFYTIDDTRIVSKYHEIFKDTFDNWSSFGFKDYDYRMFLFEGKKVVQNLYINEGKNSYSFRGTKNMAYGSVRNDLWDSLALYMKPLESEMFIFPDAKIAEEFFQLARSKNAFVSTPYFCSWREHEGELFMKTDLNGVPISLDSLKVLIKNEYSEYDFDIQSADIGFGNYHHPKIVKVFSSQDFFENFEFRGRKFEELIDSTFYSNRGDFLYEKPAYYTEFNILTPDFNNYDSIKVDESKDTISIDFEDLWQENYRIYSPIIEVAVDSTTMSDLKKWLKEKMITMNINHGG